MQIIKQSAEIISITPEDPCALIASAARTCYQSAHKTKDMPEFDRRMADYDLIRRLIKAGHHSVLEHASITARIITDRATTHELVRHRLAAYSQESTRYCNYGGKGLMVIWPVMLGPFPDDLDSPDTFLDYHRKAWRDACLAAEEAYMRLIAHHATVALARKVLPQSLKAEIVMTANIREWRHVLRLRASKAADPQIRQIAIMLLAAFTETMPVLFEDLLREEAIPDGIQHQ